MIEMKDNTDPATWRFLLPDYWVRRAFDPKPVPPPKIGTYDAFLEAGPHLFQKPDRQVHTTFMHCSASDNPKHDNIETIRRWHMGKGWRDIGYHGFIDKAGDFYPGRSLDLTPAAQGRSKKSKGKSNNPGTMAFCVGGKSIELFTPAQMLTLRRLCDEINEAYGGRMRFRGHREVSNKACPVFDYRAILELDDDGYMTSNAAVTS